MLSWKSGMSHPADLEMVFKEGDWEDTWHRWHPKIFTRSKPRNRFKMQTEAAGNLGSGWGREQKLLWGVKGQDPPQADPLLGAVGNAVHFLHWNELFSSFPSNPLEKTSPSGEEAQALQSRQGVLLPITCPPLEYLIFFLKFSCLEGRREAVFY